MGAGTIFMKLSVTRLGWYHVLAATCVAAAVPSVAPPRAHARAARAVAEYRPYSAAALASLEVETSATAAASAERQPVTDAALFVSKSGGDVEAALRSDDGVHAAGKGSLFNVRLFIVAGGRLYGGGRGQCGAWESDVSFCSASCDSGVFAIRRNGAAPLELLLGALPGGPAGAGTGLTISGCGLDEGSDAKLVAKAGRGLAVAGFGRD
jgi:hypothetical protein